MTIDQFKNTGWSMGMTAKYHGDGHTYPIVSVDFAEMLVGLEGAQRDSGEIFWARCENITITSAKSVPVIEMAGKKSA